MKIKDLQERVHALDITKSFIVQAPAGSGKTTLLVQRFLSLLQMARYPEEIVALTFTRKAAKQMQSRVIAALDSIKNPPPTNDIYAHETYLLAKNIIIQDAKHKWNLLKNPKRLRIQTIDSFCHYLIKHLPLSSNINSDSIILQDIEIEKYYKSAALKVLEHLGSYEYSEQLKQLLVHLDNDWYRLTALLIEMLKRREQWLPYLVPLKNNTSLRKVLEKSLLNINLENAAKCLAYFPKNLANEFMEIFEFALQNLQYNELLQNCKHHLKFTSLETDSLKMMDTTNFDYNYWRIVASILLTKDYRWRQKFTKDQGLPADKNSKPYKERALALIKQLEINEELRQSLQAISETPLPTYSDAKWNIISALLSLLPLAVAELKLLFQTKNVADHAEISMSACEVLGTSEQPSKLALQLDYQIQHLLIDEFQDTSMAQFRLLEKLVAGWQDNDGKTIFAVGDPMQSIYRFREAEVGIFLRTLKTGIGSVKLIPITLQTNFRSTRNIIDWINTNFVKILPSKSDIYHGAVPFTQAYAVNQDEKTDPKINLLKIQDDIFEAKSIVENVLNLQKTNPHDSIAILVRSRNNLREIIPRLRKAKVQFQAIDLDILADREIIQDLFALTRALMHPGDKVAWLAILRAPWCGLTLNDLYQIAHNQSNIIWNNILNYKDLSLSSFGKLRIERFIMALESPMQDRGRKPIRELVETAWKNLNGSKLIADPSELENSELYFALLDDNLININDLEAKLKTLFAKSSAPKQLQIMTIHKAKGLEFDHVIIPSIDKPTRKDDPKILLWSERTKEQSGSDFLLAPIRACDEEFDPIYRYLQQIEQKKNFYETGRLLYVAMTRAKKSLQLYGAALPGNNSLLEQMQQCIQDNWIINNEKIIEDVELSKNQYLKRYVIDGGSTSQFILPSQLRSNSAIIFDLPDDAMAIIGTVLHKELQRMSLDNLANWTPVYIKSQTSYWRKLLLQLGCNSTHKGLDILYQAVKNILNDIRGRWILEAHEDSESELSIYVNIDNEIKHMIIDRTFIDKEGVRWIIDYKTFQPNNSAEEAIYIDQLNKYRKAMELVDKRPIRLALYYPLFAKWQEIGHKK